LRLALSIAMRSRGTCFLASAMRTDCAEILIVWSGHSCPLPLTLNLTLTLPLTLSPRNIGKAPPAVKARFVSVDAFMRAPPGMPPVTLFPLRLAVPWCSVQKYVIVRALAPAPGEEKT
jgi:hypothetical protein